MINDYIRPKSIEEAYGFLTDKENSQLVGGGAFLRLGSKDIDLAIDICDLDLNFIRETATTIEIGAMTTFREIEKSETIKKYFGNMLSDSVKEIVGVQFKNYVTVGGSVYPKYGFSDLITAFLALDSSVVLYKAGEIKLEDYLKNKTAERDILTKIIINKERTFTSFKSLRKTAGDYSILNAAVSKNKDGYRIAVGARPGVAVLVSEAMEILNSTSSVDEELVIKAAEIASENLSFGSNYLASAEYRKDLCSVLVKRALMEVIA